MLRPSHYFPLDDPYGTPAGSPTPDLGTLGGTNDATYIALSGGPFNNGNQPPNGPYATVGATVGLTPVSKFTSPEDTGLIDCQGTTAPAYLCQLPGLDPKSGRSG